MITRTTCYSTNCKAHSQLGRSCFPIQSIVCTPVTPEGLLTDGLNDLCNTEWYSSPECLSAQSAAHVHIFLSLSCREHLGCLGKFLNVDILYQIFGDLWHSGVLLSFAPYALIISDRLSLSWTLAESSQLGTSVCCGDTSRRNNDLFIRNTNLP